MDCMALYKWIQWLYFHGLGGSATMEYSHILFREKKMGAYDNCIILIPALQPDERLIQMIHGLYERGFHKIAVTDDGSSDDRQKYFQEVEIMGVKVIHHSKKMGKGVALRSALRLADEKIGESDFYITADCDGQYSPEDIEKVAKELLENPDCFVLGVRTYERKKGKKVRFWLNSCQKLFFRITNHGKECPDPRSGLRGFPASLKKLALCTEGKSYDYELNFLDAAIQKTPVVVVPISSETHNINETSHFRPVVDLLGMYLKFWKYLFTSNVATVFDLVFFIIFESLFSKLGTISIFVATICARAISGSVGYILNRYISFQSKLNPGREMVRYSIVFVCQMAASGILVSLLSVIPIPTVIVKAIIDTILFFVVYNIQKNWVFAEK